VFNCIVPTLTETSNTATATLDLTGTDITKARFTLKRSIDDVVFAGPTIVNKVANSASLVATGLAAATDYYWEIELYATINNVEVISSSVNFLGIVCGPHPVTTDAAAVCNPITSMTVSSIEIV